MDDHDNSYKHLFAHTRMARDLFTGFLSGHGLPDLATASLEKINASHVTDDLRSRHSDLIWRVHFGAPVCTEALIEPTTGTLQDCQPSQCFLLLDEGAMAAESLAGC